MLLSGQAMARQFLLRFGVAAAALGLGALAAAEPRVIPLTLPSGAVYQTELMSDDQDRQMGLMFRPSLAPGHALLFVFEASDFHGIWMKNCKFPIDIVWLDENRKVVHVAEAVPPCKKDPCPVYLPQQKASYVVEMNARQAAREKAVIGATFAFSLDLPAR
jgi:uncharacterized membrane protein (UPF0127 family)